MNAAISGRRSIRKYKSIPVERELIEQVLQAGLYAPSSKNRQPWKFIVTSGKAKKLCSAQCKRAGQGEKQRGAAAGQQAAPGRRGAHIGNYGAGASRRLCNKPAGNRPV